MNTKQQETLRLIHAKSPPGDVEWSDIESMLRAAGVKVIDGAGSRVVLVKGSEVMVIDRPKPKPLAVRATVRDLAAFLRTVGIHA